MTYDVFTIKELLTVSTVL